MPEQNQIERRFLSAAGAPITVETRADGSKKVTGYAAVFYRAHDPGTEFELWTDFRERIMPGAFDSALKEKHDARALYNHDPSMLLGRRSAGTLVLSVDERGLKYEITPPDTQVGRDVVTSIQRGDLTGSSFAFRARKVTWVEERETTIRQVEDLELFDVGPVTYPAYESTTTGVRSNEGIKAEFEAWRRSRQDLRDAAAVAVRARLVALDAE